MVFGVVDGGVVAVVERRHTVALPKEHAVLHVALEEERQRGRRDVLRRQDGARRLQLAPASVDRRAPRRPSVHGPVGQAAAAAGRRQRRLLPRHVAALRRAHLPTPLSSSHDRRSRALAWLSSGAGNPRGHGFPPVRRDLRRNSLAHEAAVRGSGCVLAGSQSTRSVRMSRRSSGPSLRCSRVPSCARRTSRRRP
jgi:hypothetical protein